VFEDVAKRTPVHPPALPEFVDAPEWKDYAEAAKQALAALQRPIGR